MYVVEKKGMYTGLTVFEMLSHMAEEEVEDSYMGWKRRV